MNISELKQSKFLKKEDVGPGMLLTIMRLEQDNVAKEGAPEELKWILFFHELEKGMVLNSTCGQAIAKITGSEESDGWIGKKIVAFNDPNVNFAGRITGGIRIRAPKTRAAGVAAQVVKPSAAPKPIPATVKPSDPVDSDGIPINGVDGAPVSEGGNEEDSLPF